MSQVHRPVLVVAKPVAKGRLVGIPALAETNPVMWVKVALVMANRNFSG